MADETLLSWAEKQPSWARDALRRLALNGGRLTDVDKTEIALRVRHHVGIAIDPAPVCIHLDAVHLGGVPTAGREAALLSLGPVENLNRLAEGQQLKFGINGITLIYGENGCGKSGYARIAKKLCRSITEAELLGNVFDEAAKPPAKVKVRFRTPQPHGTKDHDIDWIDGQAPPVEIADIAVFDSASARLYVDKDNRISFLPRDIAMLQSHVDHCGEMDNAFDTEIKALEKHFKSGLPTGYTPNGNIAALLAKLDQKSKQPMPTADEITKAADWTDANTAKLAELEALLAADPAVIAARCRRALGVLEGYKAAIAVIENQLSSETEARIEVLRAEEHLTAETAKTAATDQFADAPLAGVGQSVWRQMYEHAKAYAVSLNPDTRKLPDAEGDVCLMCQAPLTAVAAKRICGFNDFIAGAATKAADAARAASATATRAIKEMQISAANTVQQTLAEYGSFSEARKNMAETLMAYFSAAATRRDALLKAVSSEDFQSLPALAASPEKDFTDEIATLETEAAAFEKASEEEDGRKEQQIMVNNLRDRKKLSEELAMIIARHDDLEHYAKLKKCREEVKSDLISRKITSLRRSSVMEALEKRILDEIKALDLTHIPFHVQDRSDEGESLFGVVLDAPNAVQNSKVLSEGEQRALALACFLGEATSHPSKHGLIIDDPVSSLDHIRLRKVAERLVTEGQIGRQVIIFTHNIHFFNEVKVAAARAVPQVPVRENFIRSSGGEAFGLISELDKPWIMMRVKTRAAILHDKLKSYEYTADFRTDDWRTKATIFYADLRETWERLVEELLFGETIERFKAGVETQRLRYVSVDDDDYVEIYQAMKRASERSGHDMAAGRNLPIPSLDDMKADLAVLDKYRAVVKANADEAEKRRKALVEPPRSEVA